LEILNVEQEIGVTLTEEYDVALHRFLDIILEIGRVSIWTWKIKEPSY
jgi:hypothetical protein